MGSSLRKYEEDGIAGPAWNCKPAWFRVIDKRLTQQAMLDYDRLVDRSVRSSRSVLDGKKRNNIQRSPLHTTGCTSAKQQLNMYAPL